MGRLCTPRIAEAVLRSKLPAIAMDLTDEQLSPSCPLSRLSEIRPDSCRGAGWPPSTCWNAGSDDLLSAAIVARIGRNVARKAL